MLPSQLDSLLLTDSVLFKGEKQKISSVTMNTLAMHGVGEEITVVFSEYEYK